MKHFKSLFAISAVLCLVACAPQMTPSEQVSSSSSSEMPMQSSSALSTSSSSSKKQTFRMTIAEWSNGTVATKGTVTFPELDYDSPEIRNMTKGLDGNFYVEVRTSVIRINVQDKSQKILYRSPEGSFIDTLHASSTHRKLYVIVSKGLHEEQTGEQKLLEIDLDTEELREIVNVDFDKPYTRLRFVSNTRRTGDIVYCVCGGEGGGSWETYYLFTADGKHEKIKNYDYSVGGTGVRSVVGYAYNADSIVGAIRDFGANDTSWVTDVFSYNIYLQQEKRLPLKEGMGYPMLSPDGTVIASFSDKRHTIFSYPDGEMIRLRTYKPALTADQSIFPEGFLSVQEKTFLMKKSQYEGSVYTEKLMKLNFDGPSVSSTVIAPGYSLGETPRGDNTFLVYKVQKL